MSLERRHHAQVVAVSGELDLQTRDVLVEAVSTCSDGDAADVVVDLSDVSFIDSSGLAALLEAHRHLTTNGAQLKLSRPTPQTMKLLTLTGLTEVFEILDPPHDRRRLDEGNGQGP